MRAAIIALAVVVAVAAATPDYATMFANFKAKYGKAYATQGEEAKRFGVFVNNMKVAEKLMKVNPHAVFGANEFADMTAQEFKSRHNAESFYARKVAKRSLTTPVSFTEEQMKATGNAIDWRTKGAVTAIKNQGQCGSCWAFSSTGSIEGQWFLAGNKLTSLSEQELVSCDTIDEGCNGGLMDNAWTWLMQAHNGQIVTEASYPYVSGDGVAPACSMSNTVVGATISGHEDVTKTESAMATWVYANGPLSVAVDATSWQTYMGGILTNCISSQIDHGVLIVGFDENNSPPYWIIKNSWGQSWGENGYIRVEKGTDQCLITDDPCSSKVSGGPRPTPPSPTPPGPPGPTPPTPGGWFEQKTCSDDKCTKCKTDRLPQNSCIKGTGSSFMATCITDGLLVKSYSSSDCSGDYFQSVNPIDQCSIVFEKDKAFDWIMNSCGGSPPGPTPPAPTPAPGPGSFIQEQCTDAQCSVGCQNYTFALGQCLQLSGGGSAIATCNSQGLLLTEYPFSSSCSGMSIPDQMAVNQCLQDEDGTYFENFCVASSTQRAAGSVQRKVKKLTKKH